MAKKREIEKKGYIIYTLIVISTLLLLLIIRGCYRSYKEHQLTIPIIAEYVNEIKYEELNSYLIENSDVVLYTCTPHEEKCRDFEKKFKNIIIDYNLKDKIVYLNLDLTVQAKLNEDAEYYILDVLNYDNYFETYPKVAIFKDSVLLEYVEINNKVGVDRVVQLLEEHEIILEE